MVLLTGLLPGGTETALLVALGLATLGTAALFTIGLLGYRQRQTTVYLLLTIALGLLVGRSLVGVGTAMGLVPTAVHHVIEHGSDFAIAALVLYALFRTGPPEPTA